MTLCMRSIPAAICIALIASISPNSAAAQENYEIQVYGSETMPRGVTMFELHSNFAITGQPALTPGEVATNHALRETIEITRGFNSWSELGFYWFTAVPDHQGWQWVGTHLRPRVRVPESWNWPIGVSISQEFGYSKAQFSGDTWTYELRPIIDKDFGPWYVSLNPTLEKSLRGPTASTPFIFSPNVNVGYDLTKQVNLAVEYYGATGPINRLEPLDQQDHQVYAAVNLDLNPAWEINAGLGRSLTASGDKTVIKLILGRRVGLKSK